MKQSAAKTLGVAALGAAFAATGAGAANAAAGVPDPTTALGPVSSVVPVGGLAGATESLAAGQNALSGGLQAAQPTLANTVPSLLGQQKAAGKAGAPVKSGDSSSPVSGLLGGLPLGGTGINGLPLG
ncbi:ATP-binding protein [Streptomyces sp. NPDC058308]|uniref:ATP-binding protein n=1 Tax=Streptomyces sp. NPDC058308 TaxID=3346440 RepID=UPI0036EE1EEC